VDSATQLRNRFDEIFARVARSDTLATIWRGVYGADYPQDASPFSFVTVAELQWLAGAMNVTDGRQFADLACGRGGPSLFVARQTGAGVIGIDSSLVAVQAAMVAARIGGFSKRASFIAADAAATGLRAQSVDAVMSVDALQLMPHRTAVIAEVARILKAGGRFAFTTWVSRQVDAGPPFPVDYQPLLEAAGLVLERCHEPPNWDRRESAVFARIRESADALRAELGESVASMLAAEAAKMPEAYPLIRRVNVAARKPANPLQPTSGGQAGVV
jgi:SAM-dependent methyltransferase